MNNCRPDASKLSGFDKLWANIPDWSAWDGALGEPTGSVTNAVTNDAMQKPRSGGNNAPGALTS